MGATSSTQSATLTNTGLTNLTAVTVSAASPFTIAATDCGLTLDAGMSCDIDLTFTPTSAGPKNETLTASADGGLLDSIVLWGEGYSVGASGEFNADPPHPGPIQFGDARIGAAARATVEFSNDGNDMLLVSYPVIGGADPADFILPGGVFPLQIDAGGDPRVVTLTCTPSDLSLRTASLTLTTNDPSNQSTLYQMECTGQRLVPVMPRWLLALLAAGMGLAAMLMVRGKARTPPTGQPR